MMISKSLSRVVQFLSEAFMRIFSPTDDAYPDRFADRSVVLMKHQLAKLLFDREVKALGSFN